MEVTEPLQTVMIHTDGACRGNPGPGGFAAVLVCGAARKEISGGFRCTTNNRMEVMAAIAALECLKFPCRVELYSDSSYLVNAVARGWLRRWRSSGWKKLDGKPVLNADLWERLLTAMSPHRIDFHWVRGHADHTENLRCDELAVAAAAAPGLPPDPGRSTLS